jgi:hypothetical protein
MELCYVKDSLNFTGIASLKSVYFMICEIGYALRSVLHIFSVRQCGLCYNLQM